MNSHFVTIETKVLTLVYLSLNLVLLPGCQSSALFPCTDTRDAPTVNIVSQATPFLLQGADCFKYSAQYWKQLVL